jgi:hypothetical protein
MPIRSSSSRRQRNCCVYSWCYTEPSAVQRGGFAG